MGKKQYQFKVTITLEEGDDYTQDNVREIVEEFLSLGCCNPKVMGGNSYAIAKVESIDD